MNTGYIVFWLIIFTIFCFILIGVFSDKSTDEDDIEENAELLATQLRCMDVALGLSPGERDILKRAAAYIEKKGMEDAKNTKQLTNKQKDHG